MLEYTLHDLNPHIIYCGYMDEKNCPPPGTHFGMRRVKWFEIEIVLWGEGSIITEGEMLNTEKGRIFFRKPGMIVDGISPYSSYIICFDAVAHPLRNDEYKNGNKYDLSPDEEVKAEIPFIKEVRGLELPAVMKVMALEKYAEIFEKVHSIFLKNTENQFLLKSLVLQLLVLALEEWTYISKKESANRSVRNNFAKVIKVKEYIDQNTKKNMTLDELSAIAELSPGFFCKIFKKVIGVSPVIYINGNKINLAKQLLTKTNMPVKEISLECGFENETYFYFLFKKEQNISPLSYREKYAVVNQFKTGDSS